ncbi:MAG: hypothetical protein GQ546_09805 [Gammaproteobacteria bacterium]|nr:hypothetical protein [Gammaproteobacteria bacterium]
MVINLFKYFFSIQLLITNGIFFIPASTLAETAIMQQNISFSDPDYVEIMPEQWLKQAIHYKKLPDNTDLAISLDQQLYPALVPLIKDYARKNHLRIAVSEGTCGISAGALLDKSVDIGGFCCPAGETDRLPGLKYHTLGIAAIALIVHPDNTISNISLTQARMIFSGQTGKWQETEQLTSEASKKEFNKTPSAIQPIARLHCKTRPGHWRLILDNEDEFTPTMDEVATIPDMISHVAHDTQAIGYETLWMTRLYEQQIGKVGLLKVNGYSPEDQQAVLTGQYPFYRTYNISSWTHPDLKKETATALVTYIQDNFQTIDQKYAFISANQLKKYGWKFADDELIGEPQTSK